MRKYLCIFSTFIQRHAQNSAKKETAGINSLSPFSILNHFLLLISSSLIGSFPAAAQWNDDF